MSYRPPPQGWQPAPYGYGHRKPHKSNGLAIAAVVLGIGTAMCMLAVFGVVFVNNAFTERGASLDEIASGRTEQILANDLDVQFGRFVLATNPLLDTGKLPVTLRNKGRDTASFSVDVEAVDGAGNRIADDNVFAPDLRPGQSLTSDVFVLVASDKYDEMAHATFRVVEASKY